jgi:hypothetical protein
MHAARVQAMKSAGICLALLVVFAPCAKAAEQTPIESADRLFQSVSLLRLANNTRGLRLTIPTTIRQFSSWAGSRYCPIGLAMPRTG